MSEAAAPAPAPAAPSGGGAPSGGSPAPSPSSSGGGGSESSQPSSNATGSRQPLSSGGAPPAKPARAPHLIKHKHVGPDGAELEIELDIADHLHSSKHKIKSDGEERELSLAELLERAPLADGAFRRMREGNEAKKQFEQLQTQVKQLNEAFRDPKKVRDILSKTLGPEKSRQLMEQWLADAIAEEKMTPEQRELRARETESERKFREREEALERREAAFKQAEEKRIEAEKKAFRERWAKEWPGHLERAGVKVTPRTIALMAEAKQDADRGGYSLSDEEAAREVAAEIGRLVGEVGKQTPAQREEQLRLLESQPGRVAQPRNGPPPKPREPVENETLEQYRDRMRNEADEDYQRRMRGR